MAKQSIPAEIVMQRILELIDIRWGKLSPISPSHIVLDLNSMFNTICRIGDLASYGFEKFLSELNSTLREFISKNLDKKIIILYNTERTYMAEHFGKSYLTFFYEERPTIANSIIKLFISKLEELDALPNITVLNCGKFEPNIMVYSIVTYHKNVIIISRNKPVLILIDAGGYYWDGSFMYHKSLDPKNIHSEIALTRKYKFPTSIPFSLYPYYVAMRGITEHGFSGMPTYGEKRTLDYLRDNLAKVISGTDEIFNYDLLNYLYPSEFVNNILMKNETMKAEYKALLAKVI